jgi:hypothetical protein
MSMHYTLAQWHRQRSNLVDYSPQHAQHHFQQSLCCFRSHLEWSSEQKRCRLLVEAELEADSLAS